MNGKFHIFYRIIYKGDGRYYYGSHTGELDDNYRGSNKVIHQIIKKHGINSLIRDNLKTFNTREDCLKFEDRFLKLFNLKADPKSFNFKNSASGGDTWSHMDESEKLKRKELLSTKLSGKGNGNYGKSMPESVKLKMINSKTGVPIHTEENKIKISERIKREWADGKRKYTLKDFCNNRKGSVTKEEIKTKISESLKISESNKKAAKLRGENKIRKANKKLLEVKIDIECGISDFDLLNKYQIKPITLYTWKKKIKERNL